MVKEDGDGTDKRKESRNEVKVDVIDLLKRAAVTDINKTKG